MLCAKLHGRSASAHVEVRKYRRPRQQPKSATAVGLYQRANLRRELVVRRIRPGGLDHCPGRLATQDAAAVQQFMDRTFGFCAEIGVDHAFREATKNPHARGASEWLNEAVRIGYRAVERVQHVDLGHAEFLLHATRESGNHSGGAGVADARRRNDDNSS